jgi:DNA-directed RNA polymerase specialized sigma24 family protein
MTLSQSIAPHLPTLRRFARALLGSQEAGDGAVVALLEALIETPSMFPMHIDPKLTLYSLFLNIWNSELSLPLHSVPEPRARRLASFSPKSTQALLLLSVEGFTPDAIARILKSDVPGVADLIAAADKELAKEVNLVRILIIEGEPLTAMHLEDIVKSGRIGGRV